MKTCTAEEFLKDTATHQMTVLLNSDIHRHLKFMAANNGWNQWFELITWPGSLTISGDMGTWTFSRVDDMFTFFRSGNGELKINKSYWSEKLQSGDHCGSKEAKEFDGDTFMAALLDLVDGHTEDEAHRESIKKTIKRDICVDDGEHEAYRSAYNFRYKSNIYAEAFTFDELPSGRVFRYRFIWCLYAIVWGINQWDAINAVSVASPESQTPQTETKA